MYALYRKGHTHWVKDKEGREINCEIIRVPLDQLDKYRADGWVDNIEDVDSDRIIKTDKPKIETSDSAKLAAAEAQIEKDIEDSAEASQERKLDPEVDDVTVNGEVIKKDGKFVDGKKLKK